jgi:alpha-mannosidase/mannosylglycerate hydrolase
VPERFLFHAMRRDARTAPLVVTHHVTLRKGTDYIEIRTEVENTIRDHRLRVLLPSGAAGATTYLADAAFDVVERPIALRADNARYRELEVETRPQQTWTAVYEGKRGLAVVATGLPESTVRDIPERPIALTLLRGFFKTVLTNGEEGGEILGHHEFRYLIAPLGEAPDAGRLCRLGQRLAAGVRMVQIEQRDLREQTADCPAERTLPSSHSFLSVGSSQAAVTSIRRQAGTEIGTIRMFNPTQTGMEVPVAFDGPVKEARLVDLAGRAGDPLNPDSVGARVLLKPKQIATVRLE